MRVRRQHFRRGEERAFRPADDQLARRRFRNGLGGVPCRIATFRRIMVGECIVVCFLATFSKLMIFPFDKLHPR